MSDRNRGQLWLIDADGEQPPAADRCRRPGRSPRWSPDGLRIAFIGHDGDGDSQLRVLWLDSGRQSALTQGPHAPSNPVWSPDGERIAFNRFVPERRTEHRQAADAARRRRLGTAGARRRPPGVPRRRRRLPAARPEPALRRPRRRRPGPPAHRGPLPAARRRHLVAGRRFAGLLDQSPRGLRAGTRRYGPGAPDLEASR
jgi:hypothetical protein